VIYDPVGGDVFDLSTKCIAPEGRLLVVGFASGRIPSVAANRILLKNISVTGVFWGGHVQQQPGYVSETQSALAGLFRDGKICPAVTARHPLSAAPEALRELAERKVRGKAVLVSTE
jgi:NADPH2:quinone reductase